MRHPTTPLLLILLLAATGASCTNPVPVPAPAAPMAEATPAPEAASGSEDADSAPPAEPPPETPPSTWSRAMRPDSRLGRDGLERVEAIAASGMAATQASEQPLELTISRLMPVTDGPFGVYWGSSSLEGRRRRASAKWTKSYAAARRLITRIGLERLAEATSEGQCFNADRECVFDRDTGGPIHLLFRPDKAGVPFLTAVFEVKDPVATSEDSLELATSRLQWREASHQRYKARATALNPPHKAPDDSAGEARWLTRQLELDPLDAVAAVALADLHYRRGDRAVAHRLLKRTAAIPDSYVLAALSQSSLRRTDDHAIARVFGELDAPPPRDPARYLDYMLRFAHLPGEVLAPDRFIHHDCADGPPCAQTPYADIAAEARVALVTAVALRGVHLGVERIDAHTFAVSRERASRSTTAITLGIDDGARPVVTRIIENLEASNDVRKFGEAVVP